MMKINPCRGITLCGGFLLLFCLALMAQSKMDGKSDSRVLQPAPVPKSGNYCVECHKNLKGPQGAVVGDWIKSTHGKSGQNCNICHGGNADINDKGIAKGKIFFYIGKPKLKETTNVCGRGGCHESLIFRFKKGPHYRSLLSKGEPGCVTCHGSHLTQRNLTRITGDKKCGSCHPARFAAEFSKLVAEINGEMSVIQENIDYLNRKNAESKDLSEKLIQSKKLFYEMIHVFSTRDIVLNMKEIKSILDTLRDKSSTKVIITRRLDLLYIVTVVLSIIIISVFGFFTLRIFLTRKS